MRYTEILSFRPELRNRHETDYDDDFIDEEWEFVDDSEDNEDDDDKIGVTPLKPNFYIDESEDREEDEDEDEDEDFENEEEEDEDWEDDDDPEYEDKFDDDEYEN